MLVKKFCFNPFGVNTYIVVESVSKECVIIDPGMMNINEQNALSEYISCNLLHPIHLLNTHLHIDHVMGNSWVAKKYGLVTEANNSDAMLGEKVAQQASMFGLMTDIKSVSIGVDIADGDKIAIGESCLIALHVPGHSPGSMAFYCSDSGFVITGDALFEMSIGRTDLPGGNYNQLITAIRTKLFTLPVETVVYPGHGESTTIGREIQFNPFLK